MSFTNIAPSHLIPSKTPVVYNYQRKGKKISIKDDISVISDRKGRLTFNIKSDASTANDLHATIQYKVPTMRITIVSFSENTSVFPEEVIARSLGSLSLRAHPDNFEILEGEDMNEMQRSIGPTNAASYSLDVSCEGPLDRYVTTSDIVGNEEHLPIYKDIKLLTLTPGQKISATFHALKGVGEIHENFKPCMMTSYRQVPKPRMRSQPPTEDIEDFIGKCPKGVFALENEQVVVANPTKCTMCRECTTNGGDAYVKLLSHANLYEISIESRKTMTNIEILEAAVAIHNESLD